MKNMKRALVFVLVILVACSPRIDSPVKESINDVLHEPGDECSHKEFDERNHCYQDLAESTKNASLCPKASMESLVEYCYIHLARDTYNISMCERNMEEYKGTCYHTLVVERKDPELCEFINNDPERRYCYRLGALSTANVSLCGRIMDATERDGCIADIEGCSPDPNSKDTKESCEKSGGIWGRGGLLPMCFCNYPDANAGKECTDGDQCGGYCLIEDQSQTKGRCGPTNQIFGCFSYLVKDKAQQICID